MGLLTAAIVGSYLLHNRGNMGKVAQQAAIWVLIFMGVIAVVGLWGDIRTSVMPQQAMLSDSRIEVPRSPDGHYYLTLGINGTPVRFVVDTGATDMVLSQQDAARTGLNPDGLAYLGSAQTANGTVRTAAVRLESVTLGDFTDRNLGAVVNQGQLAGSLLGMGYLGLFDRIEIANGQLVLTR